MKTLDQLNQVDPDEYREMVEGRMSSFVELLIIRTLLLQRFPNDKNVLGGDQYLMEYQEIIEIGWEVSPVNLNGLREIIINYPDDELLDLAGKAKRLYDKMEEGENNIKWELALYSLSDLLGLPYDIREGSFWTDANHIYFN